MVCFRSKLKLGKYRFSLCGNRNGWDCLSDQAQEMHEFIRETVLKTFGEISWKCFYLYGGSVKRKCKEIFSKPDVDGGLIGGAALKLMICC
jgi:triosephosphate isomerase